MKENNPFLLQMASAMEQAQTGMTQLALIAGEFYIQLVKSGLPKDLARELVLIWFDKTTDGLSPVVRGMVKG